MIDYNERMVDRLQEQWLNPLDDDIEGETCTCCYSLASYEILGRSYCESCGRSEFIEFPSEDVECCMCGEMVDTCFSVGGDVYCEACFDRDFRI